MQSIISIVAHSYTDHIFPHAGHIVQVSFQEIELGVGAFEPTLNVQLWKNYEDEMEIYQEHPAGKRVGPLFETLGAQRWQAGNTELLIYLENRHHIM